MTIQSDQPSSPMVELLGAAALVGTLLDLSKAAQSSAASILQREAIVRGEQPAAPDPVVVQEHSGLADAVTLAHRQLAEDGFPAPSTTLLRARLMLDHARNARDLGHGWPGMLHLKTRDLEALDAAERTAATAYRAAVNVERAGGDLLAGSASPAELTLLLRRAQAQRDEAIAESLKYETRLAIAEIVLNTAVQENRAPIWPPASAPEPSVDASAGDRMIAPIDPSAGPASVKFVAYEWKDTTGWSRRVG